MTMRPPHLSLAVEARVDSEGKLLSADPHVMRLHRAGGGVEDGALAIPQLLNLARLAWRTGARIERSIIVADGENDLDLWVSAVRQDHHVLLSILGWQEVARRRIPVAALPAPTFRSRDALDDVSIVLDPKAAIVSIAPEFIEAIGIDNIGRPLDRALVGLEAVDFAKFAVDGPEVIAVSTRSNAGQFAMTVTRLNDALGRLLGFECNLQDAAAPLLAAAEQVVEKSASVGFGRKFASAVRQPLSRIIANAETIGTHVNGPVKESYAGYAHDIASAARHLAELVSDLEDLDAIDRDDFHVASEKVELGDIARRVAGLLALKAADHQINIELPEAGAQVEVAGEFRRTLQIVLNLVGNAIRYAPDGSTVRIDISDSPLMLTVSDEGRGIAPDERERVFEKFERLGRSGDGGSGLGLYISRRLARAMKGDLSVGDGPRGGAMFTLTLPRWP